MVYFNHLQQKNREEQRFCPRFSTSNGPTYKLCHLFDSVSFATCQVTAKLDMAWLMHHIKAWNQLLSPKMSMVGRVLNAFFIFAWNWSYRGAKMVFIVNDMDPDCLHINYWPMCYDLVCLRHQHGLVLTQMLMFIQSKHVLSSPLTKDWAIPNMTYLSTESNVFTLVSISGTFVCAGES